MKTVTVERVIDAPIHDVFDWLVTTTNYTVSPLAIKCTLSLPGEDAPYGVGAIRDHTWLIGWFRERITRYERPYVTEYLVERSLPPSRHELGRMTFSEVDGGTHVEWSTRAEIPIPLIGGLLTRRLAHPVLRYAFGKILDAAENSLAHNRKSPRR